MTEHKCKKIKKGVYEYRGYRLYNVGYYNPEHRVVWEAVSIDTLNGDFHHFSKRQLIALIDKYLFENEVVL